MTSDIVNKNEIKFYDPLNDGKDCTKNTDINTNSIDFIRDDLTNYDTDERTKIISSTEDGNVCLCGKTENLIENNKNDNLTLVYIAGMDDSLMELKRNIQKYGEGHELKVNFYLYKNQKCYDLGYLYTDAYVLRYFIPNCENYFCLDNIKNNWCLDNLSRKHYNKDFNRQMGSLKFDEKVENYNNQPIVTESKNLCNLIEYVPKEVAGHYEINIPKEQQYIEKNVLDDLNSNNLGKQNTNINNNMSPQISLLEPEGTRPFKTVKNDNIDYADEENDVNSLNFVTGNKVYKQDVNKLEEAINNNDYMTSNDITYNDNKKEYIIDIYDSMYTTNDNGLYKINENSLNYVPTNSISGKESDYNYVISPCSSEYMKEGDNDIVTSEKNYELLKIVHSYDENNQEQKEFGHNLQYDDGTGTKPYNKCFKTNDVFNYEPEIPNTLFTPRYIGGIKTIGNPLNMKPLKLTFYPYQAYVIPNLQAKNMVCMNKNDPEIEIVDRTFYNNEPILSRSQASEEQRNGKEFQGYIPTYDLENQIQSPQTPYEEATLNDNNIINDIQSPINQETYLKMPEIDNGDKRNYVTSPKFNENQNKIPWHIEYIPNVANMWKNLPNIQKQLVSDSLNTPREVNKNELLTNLQSESLFAKSLTPCINTNNYDMSANSKINFLEPQYEKERLYDTKNMFPNTYDTDASEKEILSLKDNINNVSPRTEYFMQDPCIYKNLKSLVGSGGSYYRPITNYENTNTQIIDKTPYNSDLTKKTFKLKYYPHSVALLDTSIQNIGRGITSSISPTTINFKPIVENTSDNILIPETNPVTTQDIKNPFNTFDQYTQNYKIPSRIIFTPLSYKIYPLKIVSPKPLTSNICHSNPYLGLNKPVLYKNFAHENLQHNTPLIPTIVENIQSINKMNDISQKSPIQFSDNVVSNNFNINPFVSQNQNLQDSMYSLDPTTRNTVCFTKLFENEKPIVDEYQPTKSVTSDTSYEPFSNVANVPNAEKSLKFYPKISISRDSLDPNIIGKPIKNSYAFATAESKYPEIFEKTPFDVNLEESTGASSLRYKLLNPRPNTEILNSYINQTPQDEINIYNTNIQNPKTPAVTHYTVYPTPSLQNILISKPHNVMPTPYLQPTVTHSGIPVQNGYTSNLYRNKLEDNLLPNSISQVFPIGLNTNTLSWGRRLKLLKGQNINDVYNKKIQSRFQETPIYQQPLQNNLNYETVSTMPVKFSPYVAIPGSSGFVEETNKLRNNKANQHMINFKEIPVGTIAKDKGNYIIYNPKIKIDNLANTSPKYSMTSISENEILTPDYSNSRQDPLSKLYDVCERKQNYFDIPIQSGNVPESSPREYIQYSRKPQELLDTEPASSLTYYLPTAKLLPVKTSNINKGFVPVPTKVLLNTYTDIVQSPSTSNREYSLIPNNKNFIPQLILPSDRSYTGATGYQSKITPVGNTYFNIPYTYDNLKDTYKNNLQTLKENMLDGFYSTSPPKIRQEEIQSSRNEDFIDYNKIGNEGRVQMYLYPYMRVLNYKKGPLQTTIKPKIWSTNTILPKNLVVESNEPNRDKLTVPSTYNSDITGITPNTRKYNYILNKIFNIPTFTTTEPSLDAKLASQVITSKTKENGEIIQTEIPEGNQEPITFGNIRYCKPEYQIKITNNIHQGQDNMNIFNAVPEFKQNYLENPSNLDNLNLFGTINPRTTEREKFNNFFTANIEPSRYLQDNGNPIYLTPYFSRYQKPSSINNVAYPFTVKPSLAQKQSVQDAFNQIVSSDDPNTPSMPNVYENLNYGIDQSGTQRITSLKQLSNLYYNPVDLRKSVNSVYDIGTQQNNGYISYSSLNFNPISSSYIAEKDSYNTATTKNIYQYFNPTVMKINRQFNWPSKLINYMSPVESYKEQKNNIHMPSDYININSDSLTKTAQTSALPNTQNNAFFGHGNTPLINTFDWKFNLQRKEPPATSQYSSYTQYPNTFTSPFSYKSPEAYHPPIPLNADLNSYIYNDISYSNIPRGSFYISPNAAEIISPKNNIFFNLHNDLKQPINQYNRYISDEAGQNYYVNDNNEIATPNMKQFPITSIMQHEKYNKQNYLFSKLHDSPQTVNIPSHVTYNSKSIPMQTSQGLFSNIDNNPKYASLNLLYPKNIYSYSSSIPKESKQNFVKPLLSYTYLNKDFDYSSPTQIVHETTKPFSTVNYSSPTQILHVTKPFSTVKTVEATPVWNNLGTKNSLFTEYNPLPRYDSWKRLPLSEVNFNSIPRINSFITDSNICPITSTAPGASSDRIFNNNDHVGGVVDSDYNMITQNIGAFQSNAVPMLLPSSAFQTKIESNPLVKSRISCTNVIPTNQPLSDFSSGLEPQRLISNKTSSEILKSNNDLVYPEQIYSEQGKITFLPKINSYCYDVKGNNLPIHSNEYHQKGLNEKDANMNTIEDNNYSDLYKIENQKYDILPSISQIEKQIPSYNYDKMKNPFLKSQFADLNYPFNLLTKPDVYNKFDKISSNINPYSTFKPLRLYSPTYYQKQNIYNPSFFPTYENSLSIQNHNLLNSVKTSPCTRSEHILFTPHVCKVFKPSTYPISTNEDAELYRSNLNKVYESPSMISSPKYLSPSYIEPNRPIYKSIQYQNPAMYQSGNAIWGSDSEKYSNYKQTNSLPYIINYDLSQHKPFNPASTSNIPLQQVWKHNIQGFIKSQIENVNQDNPLTKTCYQEDNYSNKPLLSQIFGSNIMDNQNNMKYYQTLPKIVIAKYDPTCHNTFVIKTGDCDLKLKTWRSKLKVITPILVYKVKEIPTINFMPIRNTKYTTEEDMEKAKNYVAQKYGCPTIIKGIFSAYKPYAYINDSSALRDNMPVIWPTLCTCGCGRSGCRCRNK
ncbi:unnamed protein product [Danaus chrysippus]|uniref:(African queen) hypothetical protein n=1 Tax=Danaus chrysippus TaxID=151541 RepID=A0A8J2R4G3_9NEOP|nr:unnamed protein product [Danaus chrysippus]